MTACRACGAELPAPFLSLGAQPLSNAYLRADQLAAMEPTYPLDLSWCARCGLVQLPELARAEHIFDTNYAYFSSFSQSWLAHSKRYAEAAIARFALGAGSFVVEAASNDGYLLQYFAAAGVPVLGVEPARACAEAAVARGVPTEVAFFTESYARAMPRKADLWIGNNVLAHNPNLVDFVRGITAALAPSGVATLEFPHLARMLAGTQFDTIYHEHYSYLSLHAVDAVFRAHGLAVFDVDELPTHGGSLRVYAQLAEGRRDRTAGVERVLAAERAAGLMNAATYDAFAARVAEAKRALLALLIDAARAGKTIAGYGAPAKGNTLLNYCGVRTDFVAFTVDASPHKQGKFLPGTRIPILAVEALFAAKPDLVLVLPWNLEAEIVPLLAPIAAWGGRALIPIPTPRLV